MRNFQGTFEKRKQSLISAFSICISTPLNAYNISISSLCLMITPLTTHPFKIKLAPGVLIR